MLQLQNLWIALCLVLHLVTIGVVGVYNYSRSDFPPPPQFIFGSGGSAYQVEGAAFEDGRTASIWDTFVHAGYVHNATGDIACDQYHKYKEDVKRMAETGLEAYRFSISWSRLIPNGKGPINPKGLQYYNNLTNEIISNGIQPHATLFHWDLPQALEDENGGWLSRKTVEYFTAYADVCFREFGDRIKHWVTFNQPNMYSLGGYGQGITPPGRCSRPNNVACARNGGNSSTEPYIVAHNLLLAHASVANLYKRKYKDNQHGSIGLNLYAYWYDPYSNATDDMLAVQRAIDFHLGWFLNPLVFGDYPDVMRKNVGTRLPAFTKLESKQIKGSFDFVGLNHYYVVVIKDDPDRLRKDRREFEDDGAFDILLMDDLPPSKRDPVPSLCLQRLLEYVKTAYGNLPVYIHENGLSLCKETVRNSTLNDTERVEFMHSFIGAVLDAVRNGSNTLGYFQWSFLDGLELLGGYSTAFGLYYVDLDDKNLKRYAKASQHWYANFLKGKSIGLKEVVEAQKGSSAF